MEHSSAHRHSQRKYRGTPHPWAAAAKCAASLAVLLLLLTIGVTGNGHLVPAESVASHAPGNGS